MKFGSEELNEIYEYVAERLLEEGKLNPVIMGLDLGKGESYSPVPEYPTVNPVNEDFTKRVEALKQRTFGDTPKTNDAGGHFQESLIKGPSVAEIKSHLMDAEDRDQFGRSK